MILSGATKRDTPSPVGALNLFWPRFSSQPITAILKLFGGLNLRWCGGTLHSSLRRWELQRLPGNGTTVLAHSVCHTLGTLIYLTNKLETGMMDSDSAVTCSLPSPPIAHQLAYLSIILSRDIHVPQIIYRLSSPAPTLPHTLNAPPAPWQLSVCSNHGCPSDHFFSARHRQTTEVACVHFLPHFLHLLFPLLTDLDFNPNEVSLHFPPVSSDIRGSPPSASPFFPVLLTHQ